jgi:hypothetical protein
MGGIKKRLARSLRIHYENACYRVTCRGNARQRFFAGDADRSAFLSLLEKSGEIYQVEVLAYVLMDNHYLPVGEDPAGESAGIHAAFQYLLYQVLQPGA